MSILFHLCTCNVALDAAYFNLDYSLIEFAIMEPLFLDLPANKDVTMMTSRFLVCFVVHHVLITLRGAYWGSLFAEKVEENGRRQKVQENQKNNVL